MEEEVEPKSQSSQSARASRGTVWGTTINLDHTMTAFNKFFETFKDAATGELLYPKLLEEAHLTASLNFNMKNVKQADPNLYKELTRYPHAVIPILDLVRPCQACRNHPGNFLTGPTCSA